MNERGVEWLSSQPMWTGGRGGGGGEENKKPEPVLDSLALSQSKVGSSLASLVTATVPK